MSAVQTITFTGSNYTYVQGNFSDTACMTAVLSLTESGTFVVGSADAVTTAATDITYTQSAQTATPANGEAATLNTAGQGGTPICDQGTTPITFTDGTAVSIAGAVCGGTGATANTANGASLINIFEITATATPHTLEFGGGQNQTDSLGAPSTGTRPSMLQTGTGAVFSKQ